MFRVLDINLYFEMAMIPVDLVLLIFVLKFYKEDKETSYRFKIFASFVTISTMLDVTTALVHSLRNSVPVWFRMVFTSIDCFIAFFSSLTFVLYMAAFSGVNSLGKRQKIVNYIVNISYILLLAVNLFTPLTFYFNEKGDYCRGPLFSVMVFIYPFFYILEGCLVAFRNKKKFTQTQLFCLRGALLIATFLFMFQMFFATKTMLTFYTSSLSLLILFLALENPDYSKYLEAQKQLEKAHENEKIAAAKFKMAIEVKGKFLTYLSHEMKTPINAILGYSEEILKSGFNESTKKNVEHIYGSAQRLNKFFSIAIDEAIKHNDYNEQEDVVFNSDGYEIMAHFGEGRGPAIPQEKVKAPISNTVIHGDTVHRFGYKRDSAQYKILCVDDNELNMELLLKILNNFGFSTDTATNGLEAIDLVRKNYYDLILMDHMMPGMDGIDAMHIIRNEGLCDLTPIIVVTANAVKGEKEKYIREGFDSYIPKPFSGGSILRIIGKFLPVAMMDTLVKYNDSVGISRFMLASTFSRPVIAPNCKFLVAGTNREEIGRIARLLLTSLARIDVVYDGDECIKLLSSEQYDMIFVEEDLNSKNNRSVKAYIWNNISSPSISIMRSKEGVDPSLIYENFTDYIEYGCESDILDAMMILYLPKDRVYVVGSDRYEKNNEDYYSAPAPSEDVYESINESIKEDRENEIPMDDPFAMAEDDYVLPDYVSKIEGIDIDTGISNCGSGEGFVRALEIFESSHKVKAEEIRKFFDEKDIEAYTIRVHALKSSARIIGAIELSDLAFELEQAGNNKDIDLINEKTALLLEGYKKISAEIAAGQNVSDDTEKIPADPDMMQDAYSSIYELGSMMDYDSIEMIMGQLDAYSFEPEDAERIKKIKEGLDELNWDKVVQAAKEAL